jgi:glycosyltransferase involved in cell wall biosynthesis
MKIAYITAGAGGMYCGSCMKDNTLAVALNELGHDCLLVPCYTPLRLDEAEAAHTPIFLSGLTMYLQEKYAWLRRLPRFLAKVFANPWLLRKISGSTIKIEASQLAPMTLSMLRGTDGHQREEVNRLADWLAAEVKPDVLLLSNVLMSGIIPALKQRLGVPVVTTLQGDDIFLEELPADARREAIALIRDNCAHAAAHIATSRFYADFMANYLGLSRESIHVVYPGINLKGFPSSSVDHSENNAIVIGYLARIAPEKGFHLLVDALSVLNQMDNIPPWRLRAAGYLAGYRKDYLEEQRRQANAAGWGDRFEYIGEPDREEKVRFLESLDVLSVPTTYQEPKGLYILEALACGVPVVQPRHGSFPELMEATQGGLLVMPNDARSLAEGLATLLRDDARRSELGTTGQRVVHERFTARTMAEATGQLLATVVTVLEHTAVAFLEPAVPAAGKVQQQHNDRPSEVNPWQASGISGE